MLKSSNSITELNAQLKKQERDIVWRSSFRTVRGVYSFSRGFRRMGWIFRKLFAGREVTYKVRALT